MLFCEEIKKMGSTPVIYRPLMRIECDGETSLYCRKTSDIRRLRVGDDISFKEHDTLNYHRDNLYTITRIKEEPRHYEIFIELKPCS